VAQNVTGLVLQAKFETAGSTPTTYTGKLFLGVLGVEYSIPVGLNLPAVSLDIMSLHAGASPPPARLLYNYINRTQSFEEFAFADGILPVYLRYQPDLEQPLNDAASVPGVGTEYQRQHIIIREPEVRISGTEAVKDASGSTTFVSKTIVFIIPVNPPASRVVRLSPETGLMVFLASMHL
jgi:hypothetical protein